jgi:glycosyltransferase involved in cell wall biosynthesis
LSATASVSIALCTYHGAAWLEAQLESLLAQTHAPLELVAADEASTDATFAILERYAPRFARATLIRNPQRLGVRANFEQAFRRCSGDWIAPCDQDDVWLPHKLERLLGAADATTTLVYGDSLLVDEQGRPLPPGRRGNRVSQRYTMASGHDPRVFALANCISGHAMLLRRDVLARALPLPEGTMYDAWLAFVAAEMGEIRYVDEVLVQFRQHARNASGFAGQRKAQAPQAEAQRAAELAHLEALAAFDGRHRAFFEELRRRFERRGPGLALWMHRHRQVLFALKPSAEYAKWKHVAKYLV